MLLTEIAIMIMIITGLVLFVGSMMSDATQEAQIDSAQRDDANRALAQLNSEREFEANLLDEIKKSDSSVLDVYYSQDSHGTKTITMAKELADGRIQTTSVPASELQGWINSGQAQGRYSTSETTETTGMIGGPAKAEEKTEMSAPSQTGGAGSMIGGVMMGYLASQMLSSSSRSSSSFGSASSDESRRGGGGGAATSFYSSRSSFSSSRNDAVGRYTRSMSPALSAINRSGSSFTGTTSKGSFSGSGARSGGYASGG